jgi:mono/diheme cytochrome c family protein
MPRHDRNGPRKTRSRKSSAASPRKWIGWVAALALLPALAGGLFLLKGDDEPIVSGLASALAAAEPADEKFNKTIRPFFAQYCTGCHGAEQPKGDVTLHDLTADTKLSADRDKWELVLELIESHTMPPAKKPQPSAEERKAVIRWLEAEIYHVDCTVDHDPGRVTIRRLNRTEYNNTIRDLVGVDFRPADDFPSDDVGEGFDNIGDVLSISPLLLEKYLDAAEKIADTAIVGGDDSKAPRHRRDGQRLTHAGGVRLSDNGVHVLFSNGHVSSRFLFPRDGEYILRAEAGAQQVLPELAQMAFRLDDQKITVFKVEADENGLDEHDVRVRVEKGTHDFTAAFINDFYDEKAPEYRRDRNLFIASLEVIGPLDAEPGELPDSHKRLITCRPDKTRDVRDCARQILERFATRAFRRPATADEVESFVRLVELATRQGDSFERGIQVAVSAVLVSPHFLFRVERNATEPSSGGQTVQSYELASRLSYFLWSTMPDDQLFALAASGEFNNETTLRQQVRRMIADEKASELARNFGGQWLNLRTLDEITPDPSQFTDWSGELRGDMRRETELFFEEVMRQDRSIADFVSADYTFVNDRLARHYGLADVSGGEFRKVSLAGTPRAGVLTHASVLTITSNPTRTSPVKRGKWIMENILGTPPPEPPAEVPDLEVTRKANPKASLREQLELHRNDPNCAVCHEQMDALGFGFENFDAIGRWRDADGQFPVNPAGTLPGGESFRTPPELIKILSGRRDDFARVMTERMLTYALGRGLEFYDRCTVDKIVEALGKSEYRLSTLVSEIVLSRPFRMRRPEGDKR